ncbi:lysylphosphatidylglycerol synthase transmembrane domain-containing protein [Marinobacter nauticus]|uniref:Uncharacterized protein n=1 Tax=Marinobacter nauticus TaxID=2743 RepID=A0A1M2UZ42_MARNT|nr:lysylphosphatidylglycerol synthase transmembrane domain-containing protein [Marinobacter nauticus]OJT00604.1 hypothetical protein BEE62_11250 [Marinobacter nauticus]
MMRQRPWPKLLLRWAATLIILVLVLRFVDLSGLIARLRSIPPSLIALALAVSVLQVVLSAWRWRYTAGRLGVSVPMTFAVREYYLATFLNQVLPGGVMGDVNRAWRHSRAHGQRAPERSGQLSAVHAVVLERLSGQLVLFPVVLLAVVVLWSVGAFSSQPLPIRISLNPAYWLLPPLLVGIGIWLLWVSGRLASLRRYLGRLGADLKRAFAGWRNGSVQLLTSLAVLGTYLTVFVLLAFGMGLAADASSLFLTAALCLLLLLAMVVPITVSGWGVREGAAALLWPAVGLPAEQGVAISIGYGALIFLASWPGALVLIKRA